MPNHTLEATIVAGKNAYGEDQLEFRIKASAPFNTANFQLTPLHQRYYYDGASGLTSSSYITESDWNIQDDIIQFMQDHMLTTSVFAAEFAFEIAVQVMTEQKEVISTKTRFIAKSPWNNLEEVSNFPYGKAIEFEDITNKPLVSIFQVELIDDFSGTKLDHWKNTEALNTQITTQETVKDATVLLELKGQQIAKELISLDQTQKETPIPLKANLHQLITDNHTPHALENAPSIVVDFIITYKDEEQNEQQFITFKEIYNPWYVQANADRKAYSKLVRETLNTVFEGKYSGPHEQDNWIRFTLDNFDFQTGVEAGNQTLVLDLDNVDSDADFDALHKKLKVINGKIELPYDVEEIDLRFAITWKAPVKPLNTDQFSNMLKEMITIAKSADVVALIAEYEAIY